MRFVKPITIGSLLFLAQLSAFAGELAVLRNGFSIHFERKEQNGDVTRLYTGTGFVEVPSDQIASFEVEETPLAPQPAAAAPNMSSPVPNSANSAVPAVNATPVTSALSAKTATPVDLDQVVREASTRNRIDPDFVSSVIKAESNFKPHAVSKKGAQGLMQLMPATAAKLGVADPFDPKANVEAGTAHLSALLDQYHDDPIKALAAYNAGAHRVTQYNGVPPYRETRAYIAKIVRDFNAKKRAQKLAAAKSTVTQTKAVTAKPAQKKTKPQQARVNKATSPA